ncbi:unnamed protein product [Menidia menidia]|uniref:(Atlantic silverside) hypothetical protein n=1 Tax=Menidia menidia TaxID=238744 RepID=A0A8S4B5Y5_9TELE|nr:unnamed protein product [Menidia menidia]
MCGHHGRLAAGWLAVVIVAAVSVDSKEVYGKVGGEVALSPVESVPTSITSIYWKEGPDLAINWDFGDEAPTPYRKFKERGQLNTATAVMTIRGLTLNDSGVYTPEINIQPGTPLHLRVISGVPVPEIKASCPKGGRTCELICDGDTEKAGPVNYTWKFDDEVMPSPPGKSFPINLSHMDISSVKMFSCELHNPVSTESSKPIPNKLVSASEKTNNPRISTGVTVFICLLLPLLLLALLHKCKTGMWFFEKPSMPWEGDFWRRNERQQGDGNESNGTTMRQREEPDEETPIK